MPSRIVITGRLPSLFSEWWQVDVYLRLHLEDASILRGGCLGLSLCIIALLVLVMLVSRSRDNCPSTPTWNSIRVTQLIFSSRRYLTAWFSTFWIVLQRIDLSSSWFLSCITSFNIDIDLSVRQNMFVVAQIACLTFRTEYVKRLCIVIIAFWCLGSYTSQDVFTSRSHSANILSCWEKVWEVRWHLCGVLLMSLMIDQLILACVGSSECFHELVDFDSILLASCHDLWGLLIGYIVLGTWSFLGWVESVSDYDGLLVHTWLHRAWPTFTQTWLDLIHLSWTHCALARLSSLVVKDTLAYVNIRHRKFIVKWVLNDSRWMLALLSRATLIEISGTLTIHWNWLLVGEVIG